MSTFIVSQDGSHTVVSDRFGVSYHSKYGAIQETQTVFIDAGLKYKEENGLKRISILEMGFGTGLNALMTYLQSNQSTEIVYHTIEAYPLSKEDYTQLNYPEVLKLTTEEKNAFLKMHSSYSESQSMLRDHFSFTKYITKLEDFSTGHKFDIIYYDAFAPSAQEELWTQEMMLKLANMCNEDAVLVTYCAKGSFKRALRASGFEVEGLDGPIGKREMTRAHLRQNQ
ncbi:MAG: tRNA (5-methylaminomethyl-2-thiouridine)(34)-methyltransferase MnmD [Bacteroidota bacterium]